jgi:hypothetical protein
MGKATILAAAALAVLGAAGPASADVQLSLQNGHVTIVAKEATVRQILIEWARVGQTKIVNVERIPGTPVTIELRDVPEEQALKTLLRSISGYLTAPRATMTVSNTSVFDRIIVMPTMAAATAPPTAAPPPAAFATFQQPQLPPVPDDDRDDPRGNTAAPLGPLGPLGSGNRGGAFQFPQPQGTGQAPGAASPTVPVQAAPASFPPQIAPPTQTGSTPGAPPTLGMPAGVAIPGMVVPAPATQPGQGQPVRLPAQQP